MGFLSDLPLEEQQRLDQMYQQRLVQPALDMQGGTRTGLDSMFDDSGRPQPMVAAPPTISNHAKTLRQEYEQAQLDAKQYRKDSGDMGRYVMDAERPFEEWRKNRPQGLGTNLTSVIGQPQGLGTFKPMIKPPTSLPNQPRIPEEISPYVAEIAQPPTSFPNQPITSLPRPDVMRPAVMPQPVGYPSPNKGGKGGNFLNRFERLLEGLEGLVGKLGGGSQSDPSPLVDPAGGIGSISPISTPFTPSQDY